MILAEYLTPTRILQQVFAPLDVNDLACPTWGFGISTSADGTVVTTIGPPWLPLIGPPEDIFSLDPIWAAGCTGLFSDSFGLTTFALFDPPIALTPAVLLASTPPASSTPTPVPTPVPTPAAPTTTPGRATQSASPAKPASLPNDPVAPPARTEESEKASPTQSPMIASVDPASLPNSPTASPENEADPPSDPPSNSKVLSASAVAGNPPAEPLALSSSAADPPSGDSQQLPTDPKEPTVPVPVQGESPQIQSQGLGAINYNAFGEFGSNTHRSSSSSLPPQSIFTINAQTFTANLTGFRVNNAAIVPGGPGHTIDGTLISLGQWGTLTVGSSTISFTTPSSTTILVVAGQTFTPNPSVFSIGSSIVSIDGAAVTVDGTTISLQPSGTLVVGSSTIPLLASQVSSDVTIDGYDVKAQSSFVVMNGIILNAAVAGVIISEQVVSLEAGGKTLDIGTERFALPTGAASGSVNVQAFTGGQGKKGVDLSCFILIYGVCGIVMLLV